MTNLVLVLYRFDVKPKTLTMVQSHIEDSPPQVPPPSYNEAISESNTGVYSASSNTVPSLPPRPSPNPSHTSRPGSTSYNRPSVPSTTDPNQELYTANTQLPFRFPKGYFCKKCKNTGFKVKNGKMCKDCWGTFYLNRHAYNPNPELPFRYPTRYMCSACNNTGYKRKNGKSCKDCWEMFGPRNRHTNVVSQPSLFGITDTIFGFGGPGPSQAVPVGPLGPLPPIRVYPGDPRLGGILCGRCRGSGLVWNFLDEDLCPVCSGVGRVLNGGPPPTPSMSSGTQGPYQPGAPFAPPPGAFPPPPGSFHPPPGAFPPPGLQRPYKR